MKALFRTVSLLLAVTVAAAAAAQQALVSEGTYMLVADGSYEASLLLFDEIWTGDIWHDSGLPLSGDPVIAVPARDVLLVTGSRDERGLATLRRIAAEIVASEPYRLTDRLFIYREGRFRAFDG